MFRCFGAPGTCIVFLSIEKGGRGGGGADMPNETRKFAEQLVGCTIHFGCKEALVSVNSHVAI